MKKSTRLMALVVMVLSAVSLAATAFAEGNVAMPPPF